MNKKVLKVLMVIVTLIMLGQIILSFIWMATHLYNIPTFGDTIEYYNMATGKNVIDQYRTIGYVLVVRFALFIESNMSIPYQIPIYFFQTLLCFLVSVYVFSNILTKSMQSWPIWKQVITILWVSLYITCLPLVTYFNFTVLSDSLSTTFTLLFVVQFIRVFIGKKHRVLHFLFLWIITVVLCLIRADRMYICILFILLFAVGFIIYNTFIKKKESKKIVIGMMVLLILFVPCVKGINQITQRPELSERAAPSMALTLVNRTTWPYFGEYYDEFPDIVRMIITRDEANKTDEDCNNVLYYLSPILTERVGEVGMNAVFNNISKTMLIKHPLVVIKNIIIDFAEYFFRPFTGILEYFHIIDSYNDWNLSCVSGDNVEITNLNYLYYIISFGIFGTIGTIGLICKKIKQWSHHLTSIWLMSFVLAGTFAAITSAPVNDRYTVYIDECWVITFIALLIIDLLPQTVLIEDDLI